MTEDMTEDAVYNSDLQSVKEQLDRMETKVNELHQIAQQMVVAMEQFQSGGMGKMLMNMMGAGRK